MCHWNDDIKNVFSVRLIDLLRVQRHTEILRGVFVITSLLACV